MWQEVPSSRVSRLKLSRTMSTNREETLKFNELDKKFELPGKLLADLTCAWMSEESDTAVAAGMITDIGQSLQD